MERMIEVGGISIVCGGILLGWWNNVGGVWCLFGLLESIRVDESQYGMDDRRCSNILIRIFYLRLQHDL